MSDARTALGRHLGVIDAVMLGLGSILGTGVFISLGFAAGLAGPSILLALLLAGILASCNGLSTAQLAASHPLSGGTYEYAYLYLGSWPGYLAGWFFLCAKSASAATAALGFGSYARLLFNGPALPAWLLALVAVLSISTLAACRVKKSSNGNRIIVLVTLTSLILYIAALSSSFQLENLTPFFASNSTEGFKGMDFFQACALLFVAYTGYGRVATLGEEIIHPKHNIPKAVIITLAISFLIYGLVAIVSLGSVGSDRYHQLSLNSAAPLELIALEFNHPVVAKLVGLGAMLAMLGVLLNLILGLSRVVFAMGRRGDLPQALSRLDKRQSPLAAIIMTAMIVVFIVSFRDIETSWSFSAMTVLIYYSLTNLSALRLPEAKRLYPRVLAWLGLFGCFSLIIFLDFQTLLLGGLLGILGGFWRYFYQKTS